MSLTKQQLNRTARSAVKLPEWPELPERLKNLPQMQEYHLAVGRMWFEAMTVLVREFGELETRVRELEN